MRKRINRKVLLAKNTKANQVRAIRSVVSVSRGGSFHNRIQIRSGLGRVCVIRKVGGIGDILMITPSLRQLRIDFPELHITYAVDMHSTSNNVYFELMKNADYINDIVDARYVNYSLYDEVIDISSVCIRHEHQDLPSVNRVDLFARAMGISRIDHKRPWYKIEEEESLWASSHLQKYRDQGKKIVVLHTASMEPKRSWPSERYVSLVRRAEAERLPIQFVVIDFNNTYSQWDKHPNVFVASRTSLREMAALINQSDLFIGPDSGPMHLAGALGIRSLVLFGSIPPEARINYYPSHTAVRNEEMECLGCWYRACPFNTQCMTGISSSRIFDMALSILKLH